MRIIGRHTLRWPIRGTTLVTLPLPLIIAPRYRARARARVHPGCKPFSGAGKHPGRPSGRDVMQIKWLPPSVSDQCGVGIVAQFGPAPIHATRSIFGESIEFFYESQGATGDYLVGGDAKGGPIRSMSDPKSLRDGFYPDVYRDRYQFALTLDEEEFWDFSPFVFVGERYITSAKDFGYGGEHWNSLILSHTYYLAVEGGTHRTSGVTVEGIGGANREEMERIFFHAMRGLMPASASLQLPRRSSARQQWISLRAARRNKRSTRRCALSGLPPDREGSQQ